MRVPSALTELAGALGRAWGPRPNLPLALLDALGAPGSAPRTFAELRAVGGEGPAATAAAVLLLERLGYVDSGVEDGVRRYAVTPGLRRLLAILHREAAA